MEFEICHLEFFPGPTPRVQKPGEIMPQRACTNPFTPRAYAIRHAFYGDGPKKAHRPTDSGERLPATSSNVILASYSTPGERSKAPEHIILFNR